jgi:hypothetical protein
MNFCYVVKCNLHPTRTASHSALLLSMLFSILSLRLHTSRPAQLQLPKIVQRGREGWRLDRSTLIILGKLQAEMPGNLMFFAVKYSYITTQHNTQLPHVLSQLKTRSQVSTAQHTYATQLRINVCTGYMYYVCTDVNTQGISLRYQCKGRQRPPLE